MSTPRTKRQFAGAAADPAQRSITSFFNSQPSADVVDSPSHQSVLPATVQANLLSVGMRVRKSVPEGYKTVGTSAFKLWTDNTPLPAQTTRHATTKASSRELLPFCGINSVGGLDFQPASERDDDEVPDLDALPELTMSQESNDSVDGNSRKRFFFDDDDDELDASPRPLTMDDQGNVRVLAVPVSRTKKPARVHTQGHARSNSDFEEADFFVYNAQ